MMFLWLLSGAVFLIAAAPAPAANHCQSSTALVAGADPWTMDGALTRDDDTMADLGLYAGPYRHSDHTYADVHCFTISEYGDVAIIQDSTSSLRTKVYLYEHDPDDDGGYYREFTRALDDAEGGGNYDAYLTVYFLTPGTYAIVAGSYYDDDDGLFRGYPEHAVGSYTVSASLTAVNPLCATRTPLAFGESTTGTLTEGDCTYTELGSSWDTSLTDLYQLTVDLPGFVTIGLDSSAFDPDFVVHNDPFPGRFDEEYGEVGYGRRGSTSSYLPAGVYTVSVSNDQGTGTGEYSLSFDYTSPNVDACDVLTPIALEQTVDGALSVDDCPMPALDIYWGSFVDLYRLTLSQDAVVDIQMHAGEEDEILPDLQIYGYDESRPIGGGFVAAADELSWDEIGSYARINGVPLTAGTYVVLAHSEDDYWYEYSGEFEQGPYSLSVSAAPEPGIALLHGVALAAIGLLALRRR